MICTYINKMYIQNYSCYILVLQTAAWTFTQNLVAWINNNNFCCSQICSLGRVQWEQLICTLLLHMVSVGLAWNPGLAGRLEPGVTWRFTQSDVQWWCWLLPGSSAGGVIWKPAWIAHSILSRFHSSDQGKVQGIFMTLEVTLDHFCCSVHLGSPKEKSAWFQGEGI